MRLRQWKMLLLVAAAVVVLAAIAVPAASAAGTGWSGCGGCGGWPGTGGTGGTGAGGWCGGGTWNGTTGTWGGTGMWGTGFGSGWLLHHPDAFNAWLDLRVKQLEALKTWEAQYSANLRSADAQTALRALWQQNWNDMKAWYQQYAGGTTWVCPTTGCWGGGMWGTGFGGPWLTKHPGAFRDWIDLRVSMVNDVKAWLAQYSSDPAGTAAQTALQTMRAEHRAEVVKFFADHGVDLRAKWGCGGWMGLGGMWGGFGW